MSLHPAQRSKLERLLARLASPEQLSAHYLQTVSRQLTDVAASLARPTPNLDLSPLTFILSDLSATMRGLKSPDQAKDLKAAAKLLAEIARRDNKDVVSALADVKAAVKELANKKTTVVGGGALNPAPVADAVYVASLNRYVVPVTVKIDLNASGDLVAAISSKKIRVIFERWTVSVDTTIKFQSDGSVDLTGAMTIKSGGGMVVNRNNDGTMPETGVGKKLNVVMGTPCQMSGSLQYLPL